MGDDGVPPLLEPTHVGRVIVAGVMERETDGIGDSISVRQCSVVGDFQQLLQMQVEFEGTVGVPTCGKMFTRGACHWVMMSTGVVRMDGVGDVTAVDVAGVVVGSDDTPAAEGEAADGVLLLSGRLASVSGVTRVEWCRGYRT